MFTRALKSAGRKILKLTVSRKTASFLRGSPSVIRKPSAKIKSPLFQFASRNELARTTLLHEIEYVIYYGEGSALNHFHMWNPVFTEHLAGKFVSIFRWSASWWPVCNEPNVYAISSMNQIEPLFDRMPNLKAVFYPANNGVNLQAIRCTDYSHIFLGHGDSNKASSASKIFRLYDEVWVAGQAHIDRFKTITGDYSSIKFKIIGQPWMREWLNERPNHSLMERDSWAYVPTWKGYYQKTNYSSLEMADEIFETIRQVLDAKFKGYVKLHPWTKGGGRKSIENLIARENALMPPAEQAMPEDQGAQAEDLEAAFGNLEEDFDREEGSNLEEQNSRIILESNSAQLRDVLSKPLRFIVGDISGAVTECLYINVPIFLYRPLPPVELSDAFEKQNEFCYLFSTTEELNALLTRVIVENDDWLAEKREAALAYFVDIEGTKNGRVFEELEKLPLIKERDEGVLAQ